MKPFAYIFMLSPDTLLLFILFQDILYHL